MAEAAAVFPPDAAPDGKAREAGRLLFALSCRFTAGADKAASLPPENLPEVAFLGRSNVGKSSLLNALTGRKALARVSRTPGRTRQINFFDLGGRLTLVDLPGYGYAAASKREMDDWADSIGFYLGHSSVLKCALVLIDARHGLKDSDRAAFTLLAAAAVPSLAVLTKSDQLPAAALASRLAATDAELQRFATAYPAVFAASARGGAGIPELRGMLATLAS
ncbi:MAG TPA: ribosome biogenesis GTP-binding protein YihA/YsxC [Stellaceae bacterium]|jgi:GTP-binding protein|nr:ribosome biogenesis GTP-binding protein YihA/YsxC [Stellaceae bacterium]